MTTMYYVFDRHGNPRAATLQEWCAMFEKRDRIMAQTTVGAVFISTVFMGMEHGFDADGRPLLWESTAFRDSGATIDEIDCDRYATMADAQAGHAALIRKYTRLPNQN